MWILSNSEGGQKLWLFWIPDTTAPEAADAASTTTDAAADAASNE